MNRLEQCGKKLKKASKILANLNTNDKNDALLCIIDALKENSLNIIEQNKIDVKNALDNNTPKSMIDRLFIDEKRLQDIIESIVDVIKLDDPVAQVLEGNTLKNEMLVQKITVPLGVISIIYESRPNVTVDATVLAIKSGNCILLRGSSNAVNTNKAIVSAMRQGLAKSKALADCCILVEDTDREIVYDLLTLNKYLDLVIPRGSASLIDFVTKNATVPTIETGVGNCHLYVDYNADFDMALNILENGKVSRPSVCNALENLLVHKDIAEKFLPLVKERIGNEVEFYGCDETSKYIKCKKATENEYFKEFLDYILAIKVVENIDEALNHIDKYSSKHSEAIVTNDYKNANLFTKTVDSACVYVNASTRFTDGSEFGFGAEMGISTQKIHARGPMGLAHLVSYKYIILGNGQIRK